jgi:hypothetical protein
MLHLQLRGDVGAVWVLFSLAMIEGLSRLWSGVGVALPGDAPRLDLQHFIY